LQTDQQKTGFHRVAVALIVAFVTSGQSLVAQSVSPGPRRGFETRSELEARLREAEAKHSSGDAYLIRYRLDQGDFQDGDRIVVAILGTAGFSDTLTVRSDRVLELPQMGSFPLAGTLRSELGAKLTTYIAKYLRDPVVRVTPLIRLAVLGNVARPGFYYLPADVTLSDLLMVAGGPTATADVSRVDVRRGPQIIIDQPNTRVAISEGLSLDMLHLRAGDEITVGAQRQFNWTVLLSSATAVVGLLLAISHR